MTIGGLSIPSRLVVPGLLLCVLCLVWAGAANAQVNRPFSGQWFQNRGPLVDIPINGGVALCNPFTPFGGPAPPRTGCVGGLRPALGGIPQLGTSNPTTPTAGPYVIDNGGNPASFTVPFTAFSQNLGNQSIPVQGIPTVLRLTTGFRLRAPFPNSPMGPQPGARIFLSNAWSRDPGQSLARVQPDFNWCPGAPGNPTCPAAITLLGTTVGGAPGMTGFPNPQCFRPGINCIPKVPPTPGGVPTASRQAPPNQTYAGATFNGLVRYKSGPNAFGGTMALLLQGQGVVTIEGGALGTSGGVPRGAKQVFGGIGFEAQGGGYSAIDTDMLGTTLTTHTPGSGTAMVVGFPLYQSFMVPVRCTGPLGFPPQPPGCDAITATGPRIGYIPPDTNTNIGFPWTTGTVYAFNTGTNLGQPVTTLLTAMGSDARNALGSGFITLVAGGAANRIQSNQQFANIDVVSFNLPEPGSTLMLGAGIALVGLLYRMRRRF